MEIRLASIEDFEFYYEMKCEDYNIYWTGHHKAPDKENLLQFFSQVIQRAEEKQERKIYIISNENKDDIGYLYIIPSERKFDLPIAIKRSFSGRGYAKKAIQLGLSMGEKLGFEMMEGSIREDNIASQKAFKSCGVIISTEYEVHYNPILKKDIKMYRVYKNLATYERKND